MRIPDASSRSSVGAPERRNNALILATSSFGENGLLKQLTKLLVEKALEAEMADHLGHGKNEPVENPAGNTRNGKSRKTLKGEFGELPIEIPRDRHGTFEPQLIPKHQTRWTGFDDKILSLYARGMTVREIQSHLEEMYGTEVRGGPAQLDRNLVFLSEFSAG